MMQPGAAPPRTLDVHRNVPLAPYTTLDLGGPAEALVEARDETEVAEALRWADDRSLPVAVLGGGSNVVIADDGFPGLVIRMANRGLEIARSGDTVELDAAAGESWDTTVATAVDEGWAGVECLSGIPGTVGAAPIQNVGAYGQEAAAAIVAVRVLDRRTTAVRTLGRAECRFAYRSSVFRRDPERYVVLAVRLRLRARGVAEIVYPELGRVLGASAPPSLAEARRAVLALRRAKSMVLEPTDENRRSVGSFFLNPVVPAETAREAARKATERGVVGSAEAMPVFPAGGDAVKLSAAWLIEASGFPRGTRRGAVGTSSRHALALVHHGGGTTADLLALATEIREAVATAFGIVLEAEPTMPGRALLPTA